MKKRIVILFNCLFDSFERLAVWFLYGSWRQRRSGWRGDFARYMYQNAKRVQKHLVIYQKEFIERIQRDRPELVTTKRILYYRQYDYRLCMSLLGSKCDDWFEFKFFSHGWVYRWRALSFWRNEFFNTRINQRGTSVTRVVGDKSLFAEHWASFYGREWCTVNGPQGISWADFSARFSGKRLAAKLVSGYGGFGFRIIEPDEQEMAFKELEASGKEWLVEEYILQTGVLHELNPTSLNTIRVCTVIINNSPEVVFAKLRVGRKGAIVDNISSGGVLFNLDLTTGAVLNSSDYSGKDVSVFPDGKTPVNGFVIPHWDEVKDFCIRAHRLSPKEIHLIGWDVCLSDNKLYMIEGNCGPAFCPPEKDVPNPWRFAKQYLNSLEE